MGALVDRKLFLSTEATPGLVVNLAAESTGNIRRPVRASRIDQNNLPGKSDTLETGRQVLCLVLGYDGYGQGYFFYPRIHNFFSN
jgi:hypothetical protein